MPVRKNSVLDLKAELLYETKLRSVVTQSQLPAGTRLGPSALPPRKMPTAVALGICRAGRQHRLAVRVHHAFPGLEAQLEEIRCRARGEIDLRIVGRVVSQARPWHRKKNRPLEIGGSIANALNGAGTLGCLVTKDGETPLLLSNNHVLVHQNSWNETTIIQPSRADGGRPARHVVAQLADFVRLRTTAANYVDCAIANIDPDVDTDEPSIDDLGPISGVRVDPIQEGERVYKVGRSTGYSSGVVGCTDLDDLPVAVDGVGELRFDDQIEVKATNEWFSLGGDSGALVVDEDGLAIGLLFAGNDRDRSYLNPISTVLDALGVELLT